jgi:hypothetical protein
MMDVTNVWRPFQGFDKCLDWRKYFSKLEEEIGGLNVDNIGEDDRNNIGGTFRGISLMNDKKDKQRASWRINWS